MSIKLKIALYNTFLMSCVVLLLLCFMMSVSGSVVETSTKSQLKSVVRDNAEEVEWKRGSPDLEDLNYYENHITTLVYSHDGYHLGGYISNLQSFDRDLNHGEISTLNVGGVDYLIYDFFVEENGANGVFIRGIVSVSEVSETVQLLFTATLISLPFFILFAGFGSYLISRKSLKPLEKIVDIAQEISSGDDLSERIDLGKGKDEVHHLAHTFDTMFYRLEQAFLTEKQFSSDISHELRTPIAVILAECECSTNGDDAEKTAALKTISRQANKMKTMVNALLSFIRLDNGIMKVNLEEVDLSELVSLVCEEQESLFPENHTLQTEIPPHIHCEVDYTMMIRVLSNLMDNALKYGKEGGFIKVTLQEIPDAVTIDIADNGIGISEAHLEKIFQRFYQVDTARTSDTTHSMGLGLAMVAQMIRLHKGTITVKSQLGEGSTFTITLPKKTL